MNTDYDKFGLPDNGYVQVKSMNFIVKPEATVTPGSIAFNLIQRKTLSLGLNEALSVTPWFPPNDNIHLTRMGVEVDFAVKKQVSYFHIPLSFALTHRR